MLDFEIQRFTRRCAKTNREFEAGEEYYSCLVAEGPSVVRYDYCVQAWEEPPSGAIGWWKSRIPEPTSHKMHWAPDDVMLGYFLQLDGKPECEDVRYVLALLMIRRRMLRLEEASHVDGEELLRLFCPRNESEYSVRVVIPPAERIDEIQNDLAKLLHADGG
jgi:hypothetical protein